MYHKDGIEVYLKPHGDDFETTKLREIPLERSHQDEERERCVVYKTSAAFCIVIRFSDHFDMESASALSILCAMKSINPGNHHVAFVIGRNRRDCGQYFINMNSGFKIHDISSSKDSLALKEVCLERRY